jgi:hypothetical protein
MTRPGRQGSRGKRHMSILSTCNAGKYCTDWVRRLQVRPTSGVKVSLNLQPHKFPTFYHCHLTDMLLITTVTWVKSWTLVYFAMIETMHLCLVPFFPSSYGPYQLRDSHRLPCRPLLWMRRADQQLRNSDWACILNCGFVFCGQAQGSPDFTMG